MPSGYEKSRDYGGPEPTKKDAVLLVLFFLGVSALIGWWAL